MERSTNETGSPILNCRESGTPERLHREKGAGQAMDYSLQCQLFASAETRATKESHAATQRPPTLPLPRLGTPSCPALKELTTCWQPVLPPGCTWATLPWHHLSASSKGLPLTLEELYGTLHNRTSITPTVMGFGLGPEIATYMYPLYRFQ